MDSRKRPSTATVGTPNLMNHFNSSQQSLKSANSGKQAAAKQLSYKDYTIREEQSLKSHTSSLQKSKPQNVSDLKTTVTSMRPSTAPQTDSAHQFKQTVNQKFQNFVRQQQQDMIDDDDSLLQDSQASKTRDEKQIILQEQKQKRKRDALLKQQLQEEVARKKKAQLVALEKRQKQNLQKQARKRLTSKSRERSADARQQKQTHDMVERHRINHGGQDEEGLGGTAAAGQLSDLRSWIEQQMKEEKLDVPDLGAGSDTEAPNTTKTTTKSQKGGDRTNSTILSNKEIGVTSEKQRVKLLKHQLPGNGMLSEKEDSKLGARQNRYGVFENQAQDDFSKVVEIQREKLAPKKKDQPEQQKLTAEQQLKNKEHVKQMIISLAQKTGSLPGVSAAAVKQVSQSQPPAAKSTSPKKDDLSEDSLDKVPVRDNARGHRSIVNQKVRQDVESLTAHVLPGVTETKKVQEKLDTQQKDKESKAALVIQKFLRGHWGRRKYSEHMYRRRHEIELEYGRFDKEYKQSQQYNLKNYMQDKQKIRKQTGLDSIVEDIAEVIGESSGSAQQISMSNSLKVNNFFGVKPGKVTEFDPLSLIAIYAKKNGKLPSEDGAKPSSKIRSQARDSRGNAPLTSKRSAAANKKAALAHSSSEIVEDIYSEKFDDEAIDEDISEDIPMASSASNSGPLKGAQAKGQKGKKIIESDSIVDDVIAASLSKSGGQDDSIMDEASAAVDDSQIESDIMEDSIIRDEFSSDNVKVSQAEKQLEARNRGRFGITSSATAQQLNPVQQQVLIKAEEEKSVSAVKHKNMVSELMQEMKSYEAANINSNMMDRMEKIVISSLAQKDQIIMAQSLAELEREIRHKDEINRIREQQIQLMTQLMLLGGFGAGGSATSPTRMQGSSDPDAEKQRQEMMLNLQQMMAQTQMQISQAGQPPAFHPPQQPQAQNLQPDRESQVPMSHQQLYQQAQRKSMSYLDEYDQSKRSSNKFTSGQFKDINQSIGDSYQAPAAPAETKKPIKRQASQSYISEDSIIEEDDGIVDEIGSEIQEDVDSIGEDIVESYVSMSQSTSGFEELKKRQLKLVNDKKITVDNFSQQVEQAIDREKDTKEQKLNQKLRARRISPRTFSRQRADLEQWATRERKDLRDSQRKITIELDIQAQQSKMVTEAKQMYKDQRQSQIVGGRLVDDSADSDAVKMALNQAHLYEKGLIGQTQDQKYTQRKNEAADRLLKEKERAIDEQLKAKLKTFEQEQANDNLKRALELDVDAEAQKRFEQIKRQLEESQGQESARSAISQSRDSNRHKKNVTFVEPPHTPAVVQQQPKPALPSPSQPLNFQNRQANHQPFPSADKSESNGSAIDESIQESIGDSYSQSFKSQSMTEQSKSKTNSLPAKPVPVAPVKEAVKAQTLPAANKGGKDPIDQSNSIVEMISDNYSEGFDQSSDGQAESSKQLSQSKNKLINKAKDIAQSDAYSEDDFEESIGQSAQNLPSGFQDKTPQMDPVKEESVDQSKSETHEEPSPEQVSLPSEDVTVQNSVQSVDWQIQVPQDSARNQEPDYSQDDFEESRQSEQLKEESSINDRLDQEEEESEDQFESNPEDIGASASKSDGDIYGKADKIAQELLDLILAEYKGDNTYIVSCEKKQIDEDEFQDKFPYTLDVKEPEIVIRPPSPTQIEIGNKGASKPAPKVKTAKDIADEAYLKKHGEDQAHLKEHQDRIKEYLEFLVRRVDISQLILQLDTPIQQNPLQVLAQIQAYDDEDPPEVVEEPEQQQILSQVFFNKIDREYFSVKRLTRDSQTDLTASQEETEKIQNVHNYALFEALNEALDQRRPYKNRGGPMPWSKNTRVVRQTTTVAEARSILDSAMQKVLDWSLTAAGSKYAPLPPPPTQTQDEYGDDIVQPPLQDGEEERKNQHRQEKLGQLMTQDIQETDQLWTDYEVEDTQARFDLADMILADLAQEIAELLV